MSSKLRYAFAKAAAVRVLGIAMATTFAYTDTAGILQNTESAITALKNANASIVAPAKESTPLTPLFRTLTEAIANTRDERDKVKEIAQQIEVEKSPVRGGLRNAISPPYVRA